MSGSGSRPDEPAKIAEHEGRYLGGSALVVLGGPSGKDWKKLCEELRPDVLISVNGNTRLPGADYWLLVENMHFSDKAAEQGQVREQNRLKLFDESNTAKTLLISHRSWDLLPKYNIDEKRCIKIRRSPTQEGFDPRRYGEGLLAGEISKVPGWNPSVKVRVGTVSAQALHVAALLGCSAIHTLGLDFLLSQNGQHHWYAYPSYQPDRFRNEKMFTEFKGRTTMRWWLESAEWMSNTIDPILRKADISWHDHSSGLLLLLGAKCAIQ
jgi:hypothetical protein